MRTKVAGVEMSAVVLGEGRSGDRPVFVLVHGLGMSHRYMMPTARVLAETDEVHVPDLPGFGDSEKVAKVLTIPELSDSLRGWMESRGLGRAVLLGNSLGGQVLIDFATRHPEVAEAVILVGPTIDPQARWLPIQLLRLLRDVFLEPWRLYPIGLADYLRAGMRRNIQTLRAALGDPILEKLPLIRCPVLIVRGGRDPIVPERWVERAARLIPEARLVTIPGAAHAVNFNSPRHLAGEVRDFLAIVLSGTPVSIAMTQPEDATLGKDFAWPPSADGLQDHPNSYYLTDKYFTDHKPPTFQ